VSALRLVTRLVVARTLLFLMRLTGRRAGLVLVYHALAGLEGDPAREIVAAHAVARFESHLRLLALRYRLVRSDELPQAVAERRRGSRFPVAITFDDDLGSHVELAAPILARHEVPATFFLSGASLEQPFASWWQLFQRAVDKGIEPLAEGESIHVAAARIESMSPGEREAVAERLEAALGGEPPDTGLRRAEVRALVTAGFDVGFHTLRHDRLPELDDTALAAALDDGRAELEAALGRLVTAIAYPHGKANARVAAAAAEAGFRLGFTGWYGPVAPTSDPLLLPRIEPTFGPTAGVELQLVGALRRPAHP